MSLLRLLAILAIAALASACSTTQNVTLAKLTQTNVINSVAQVPAEGNSPQMDTHLEAALIKEGLAFRGKVPAGTTNSKDVDALVSYIDIWRWDIVMYLKKITIRVNDAATGDLLAMGEWTESHFHQFRGESGVRAVVQNLVSEMMAKLRPAPKPSQ